MNILRSITATLLSICLGHAHAADISQELKTYFDSRYGDTGHSPGAAVIIAKGDSIILEYYTGIADMRTGQPIDASTTFNIASVSKQFTVVALLKCAADSLLDIDAPMSHYVDYTSSIWHTITPRHLASQSSGVPDTRDRSDRRACVFATDVSSKAYFPSVDTTLFTPGSAYDYVNPTFILLADMVTKASGVDFFRYQLDNIFLPSGMTDTYYFDPDYTPSCQSHAYVADSAGQWIEYDYGEETFFATRPDGGIYSTARDMLAWEKSLADGAVLSPEWRDMAYSPHTDVASSTWCDYQRRPHTYYGLGWFIHKAPGHPVKVFHTGDNGGYQAYVCKYPRDDVRVIVLENRNDRDRWTMASDLENLLLNAGILSVYQ